MVVVVAVVDSTNSSIVVVVELQHLLLYHLEQLNLHYLNYLYHNSSTDCLNQLMVLSQLLDFDLPIVVVVLPSRLVVVDSNYLDSQLIVRNSHQIHLDHNHHS